MANAVFSYIDPFWERGRVEGMPDPYAINASQPPSLCGSIPAIVWLELADFGVRLVA